MFSALNFLRFRSRFVGGVLALLLSVTSLQAGDIHIKISKRTKPTPVQRLNQEGVQALAKNNTARAKRDFYHAYLLDPDDPFTLNNLGYVAELDGEIEKAQKFYDLAAANTSDAVIALSTNPELKGKEVSQVAGNAVSAEMQVNRLNVAAMALLMKDRAPEAEISLHKALLLQPKNPFTLNNLGYALEKEGGLEQATHYYDLAAASGSNEKVVVALNRKWRGRPISEIASSNAQSARRELAAEQGSPESKVARLNLRGVSALNHNQLAQALQFFQQAYRIDPSNAFSLNNMGYISEVTGDRETADYYYAKAREANRNSARVALATRKSAEGMRLASVADENGQTVEAAEQKQLEALRAQGLPPLPCAPETKPQSASPTVHRIPSPRPQYASSPKTILHRSGRAPPPPLRLKTATATQRRTQQQHPPQHRRARSRYPPWRNPFPPPNPHPTRRPCSPSSPTKSPRPPIRHLAYLNERLLPADSMLSFRASARNPRNRRNLPCRSQAPQPATLPVHPKQKAGRPSADPEAMPSTVACSSLCANFLP